MNQDEVLLTTLGYKQDLKRSFSRIELFGVSFSIIGVFPSIAGVLVFAIPYGGPVAMVWGWAVCSFFLLSIALAIAEFGSAAPTAGGLYYWTFYYSSPKWRNLLSWLVGYTNTIAYAVGVTSCDWACAVSLLAGASIGSDVTYVPTTAQTFGVFSAIVLSHAVIASSSTAILARLQGLFITLNILLCLGVIIALPITTPKEFMNTPAYAFGHFENFSSWPSGFAFILSFLSPLWTVGGFDAPVHISEEASNASFAVPFATITSPLVAVFLGWAINVVLAFCMGTDLQNIVANPINQPLATIFLNSFGKKGTLAVWSVVVVVQFAMGASILTASSRQMWAFSRDGALPFSEFLYRINPTTKTPIYSVCTAAFVGFLVGLLVFAGPTASSAIFSACVVGQYVTLSIPILCRLLGGQKWIPGAFTLGKLGPFVSAVAVLWMAFSCVVLSFPSDTNPDAKGMNYTVLVIGGWIFMCLAYYFFPVYGGVHWFKGPVSNIGTRTDSEGEDSKGSTDVEEKEVQVAAI